MMKYRVKAKSISVVFLSHIDLYLQGLLHQKSLFTRAIISEEDEAMETSNLTNKCSGAGFYGKQKDYHTTFF